MIPKYIVNKMYIYNLIDKDYIHIYEYGMELLVTNFINILIVIITGLLLKSLTSLFLYMIVFSIVRSSSGGYHAKTHGRCITIYMLMALTGIYLTRNQNDLLLIIILLYSEFIIYFLSPLKTDSKQINPQIKKKLRARTFLNIIIIDFIIVCFQLAGDYANDKYTSIIIASLFMQSITMLLQVSLKYIYNKKRG